MHEHMQRDVRLAKRGKQATFIHPWSYPKPIRDAPRAIWQVSIKTLSGTSPESHERSLIHCFRYSSRNMRYASFSRRIVSAEPPASGCAAIAWVL